MKFTLGAKSRTWACAALLGLLSVVVRAQPTDLLYDPEPPVDSAYVRFILASQRGVVDVLVDGRPRVQKLGAGEASVYIVLAAGKHSVAVHPTGKSNAYLSTTLDVIRGRAMTLALTSLRPDAIPLVFEDMPNSNKLKAVLAAYHLDGKAGPLDVLTGDGNTKVFSGLTYGTSSSIQVNPISVDLVSMLSGSESPRGRTSVSMAPGGTYSLIIMTVRGEEPMMRSIQNRIERYNGR